MTPGDKTPEVLAEAAPRLCPFPSELAALQALPPASVQGELTGAGLGAAVTRPRAAPSTGTGNAWDGLLARLDGWGLSALRERCEARRALGLERYGAPVGYGGVPRSYLDEELLDGAVYAESLGDADAARTLLGMAAGRQHVPDALAKELDSLGEDLVRERVEAAASGACCRSSAGTSAAGPRAAGRPPSVRLWRCWRVRSDRARPALHRHGGRMTPSPHTLARAWYDRWAASDGDEPPPPCEGCALPATTTDGSEDRAPREWCREALELLRDGDALVEDLTWGDHAARVAAWLERVRGLVGVERG